MSAIYRAEYLLPMTDADLIENGEVWVEEGVIRQIGHGIASVRPDVPLYDLGDAALLPGFVNAHCHLDPTLRRNSLDGLNLWQWLRDLGFRRDGVPGSDLLLASARLGAAQCARSGITCLGDCTISGTAAEAIDSAGLRGIVYKEVFGQSMGAWYPGRMARAVEEAAELQEHCSGRVKIGLSPHSVYTSNLEVLRLCAEACTDLHMPISLHLAETAAESDYTVSGSGPISDMRREVYGHEPMVSGLRPTRVLEDAGLLRQGVTLAHCIHVTPEEVELIAKSGAGVAHCPRSNAYLAAGVFPLAAFRRAGARLGLGTDSAASCLRLDFFEELRFALGLHRAVSEDAGVLLANDMLKQATTGGADALGLGHEIGRLAVGMRADMIAVDLSDMLPDEDVHLAVLSRTPEDVILRLVDGTPVESDVRARTAELRELMEQQ